MTINTSTHISFTSAEQIHAICRPLFQYFPVLVFEYSRVYANGQRCELCTEPLHLENAFITKKNMTETYTPVLIPNNVSRIIVPDWIEGLPQAQKNRLYEQLVSQRELLGIGNEMALIRRHPEYVEYFHFYGSAHDPNYINMMINHLEMLEHFITCFLNEAKTLIQESIRQPLVQPWLNKKIEERVTKNPFFIDKQSFLNATKIKKFYFKENSLAYLTTRELECAKLILQGLTAKDIAATLSRSVRTIENTLASLKDKVGCHRKSDLVLTLNALGIHLLSS